MTRLSPPRTGEGGAWAGVRILEFGAGAAGPIATRYFAEHGATVLRVESATRPDFLRVANYSEMFDALNCCKRSVTLNLKHPDSHALAKRLVNEWADAVEENFAPRALQDSSVLAMAQRVVPVEDSSRNWKTAPPDARIEIVTRAGRTIEGFGRDVPGSPHTPMTWDDITRKFRNCALAGAAYRVARRLP